MPEQRFYANGDTQEERLISLASRLAASLSYYDSQFDKYLRDPAWLQFSLATDEIKKAKTLLVEARSMGLPIPSDN